MMLYLFCLVIFLFLTGVQPFLLNSFCFPLFCPSHCPNGYMKDMRGCTTCTCYVPSSTDRLEATTLSPFQAPNSMNSFSHQQNGGSGTALSGPQTGLQPNIQGSTYRNPCIPSQAYCHLQCDKYMTGTNGCNYCICDHSIAGGTTSQPSTSTMVTSVQLKNPCILSESTCDKNCKYGFLVGPENCEYCICSPYPRLTTEATTSTTAIVSVLTNPCVPSQKCILRCDHGYVHGSSGCQYCVCNPNATTVIGVSHGSSLTTQNPNSNPLSEQCTIAIAICQVKCKTGFMTDKDDCTFCRCKAEIEKALHLPKSAEFSIQLLKPCVQEFDTCDIFCAHGYLRGPDNCQFCACAH